MDRRVGYGSGGPETQRATGDTETKGRIILLQFIPVNNLVLLNNQIKGQIEIKPS